MVWDRKMSARMYLKARQEDLGTESYVDGIWLQRIREEGEANIRRRVQYYGRGTVRKVESILRGWLSV